MNNPFDILDKKLAESYQNIYDNEIKIVKNVSDREICDKLKDKYDILHNKLIGEDL